jgi:T-complex protein 1 subunit gamma
MMGEEDFTKILQMEEAYIKRICDEIIAHKPDLVITEKGVSDLAQHFLIKAGITACRRLRKSDNLRVARACGATIVNRQEHLKWLNFRFSGGAFVLQHFILQYY